MTGPDDPHDDEQRRLLHDIGKAARRVVSHTQERAREYARRRAEESPARTSELLQELAEEAEHSAGTVSLQELLDQLGSRSFGLVLLALALPAMPAPPPLNSAIGVPIILIAWQMLTRRRRARLPRFIGDRRMARTDFARWIRRGKPLIGWIERVSRPRLPELLGPRIERVTALFIIVLAVCLAIPIPLSNFLPSLCIALMAIGFIERDGWAVFVGLLLGAFAILFTAILVGAFTAFMQKVIHSFHVILAG